YHCPTPSLRTGSGCGSDRQSLGAQYDVRTACELAVARSLGRASTLRPDRIECTALSDTQVQAHVERVVRMPLGLFSPSFTVSADFRAAVVVR
ncbi:MAG: hypothetical protein ABR541_06840, partial [Candidatus Dormibacteria bacterium]